MTWHMIRSRDLAYATRKSNNTRKLQHASTGTRLSYATTRKHGKLPKLRVPTLSSTKPQTVVSQSTIYSFTVPAVGWFSVIKYRFIDYGLLVFDPQLPHYQLSVIANDQLLFAVWCQSEWRVVINDWLSVISYQLTVISYQLLVINEAQSLLAVRWQSEWKAVI